MIESNGNNPNENQQNRLDSLRIEYETANRVLLAKEKALRTDHSPYFALDHRIDQLKASRDRLNEKNRKTRKDIKEAEDRLQQLKYLLNQDESDVSQIRARIETLKRELKPFETPYQQAYLEYYRLQKSAEELHRKITEIEVTQEAQQASKRLAQKKIELFYAILLLAIVIVISAISYFFRLPWYVPTVGFVCGLLGIWVVSAIQLRSEGKLSEENFTKLMLEVVRQIPGLLRGFIKH
jgi:predicted nuclease with TOPRIM domain